MRFEWRPLACSCCPPPPGVGPHAVLPISVGLCNGCSNLRQFAFDLLATELVSCHSFVAAD
eukprot:3938583-Rhodomonas_salina.1